MRSVDAGTMQAGALGQICLLRVNAGQQNRDEDEGGRHQGKVERLDSNVANNAIFKFGKNVSNDTKKYLSCHRQSPTVVS